MIGDTVQMTLDNKVYYDSICKWCGKQFNKKYHTQKYCSNDCREEALHEQKKEYDNQHKKHSTLVCAYCGSRFIQEHGSQIYCNDQCRKNAMLESNAKYQRKRRKEINTGCLVSNETRYVGTNYLSHRRRKDFDEEQKAIHKEMKRLKLR